MDHHFVGGVYDQIASDLSQAITPTNVYEAAAVRYWRGQNAIAQQDATVFPGDQLAYATEFHDLVQVQYPHPYSRYIPLLGAFWLYWDGDYWYVIHDMMALMQLVRRYITQTSAATDAERAREREAYAALWELQPEEFKATWPSTQNTKDWWHLPEGYPVRMPAEAVQYAIDHDVNLPTPPPPDLISFQEPEFTVQPLATPKSSKSSNGLLWGLVTVAVLATGAVAYAVAKEKT
jgi:hypothetical protein